MFRWNVRAWTVLNWLVQSVSNMELELQCS